MKILITSPSLNIHGGVRVLVEWANHLSRRGHTVAFQSDQGPAPKHWINFDSQVKIIYGKVVPPDFDPDVIVAGCPYLALRLRDQNTRAKKFFLLQMMEHLFGPQNQQYVNQCKESYNVPYPIFTISRWNECMLRRDFGRKGVTHYIGNGVSDDFKPDPAIKEKELTVLVEGWEGYNPAKDMQQVGPNVAKWLKEKYGAKIIAYSQFQIKTQPEVPDEFHHAPSPEDIVKLYQRAHILLKVGDDDLINGVNCLRCDYDEQQLKSIAGRLVEDEALRAELAANGLGYRERWLSWPRWMEIIDKTMQNG